MRLGVGTWTYPWAIGVRGHSFPDQGPSMSAEGLVDRAQELGIGLVQIADNLPLDDRSTSGLGSLRRYAADRGVTFEVGTRGCQLEHLERQVAVAGSLGSRILRVVLDRDGHEPAMDEVIATVSSLLPTLRRQEVRLAIENHDRFRVADLVRIIEALDPEWVGICLDTVNSFGALEGPDVVIAALAPYTIDLHCKDFRVRRADHQMGFTIEGAAAGDGQLDIPALVAMLRGLGRNPNAIIELWTPPAATWAATVERENAWAIRSVEYLRTLIPT